MPIMKRIFFLILIFVLGLSSLTQADSKVRLYGAFGYSIFNTEAFDNLNNAMKILFPGIITDDIIEIDKINFGGGIQAFYGINNMISVGIDVGYMRLGSLTITDYAKSIGLTGTDINFNMLNTLGVVEISSGNIIFQFGAGIYLDMTSYSDGATADTKLGNSPGFMIAGGVNIPISDTLYIPVLARIDGIFANESPESTLGGTYGGFTIPIRFMTGV